MSRFNSDGLRVEARRQPLHLSARGTPPLEDEARLPARRRRDRLGKRIGLGDCLREAETAIEERLDLGRSTGTRSSLSRKATAWREATSCDGMAGMSAFQSRNSVRALPSEARPPPRSLLLCAAAVKATSSVTSLRSSTTIAAIRPGVWRTA